MSDKEPVCLLLPDEIQRRVLFQPRDSRDNEKFATLVAQEQLKSCQMGVATLLRTAKKNPGKNKIHQHWYEQGIEAALEMLGGDPDERLMKRLAAKE